MSKILFQAKVILNNALQTATPGEWELQLQVVDYESIFNGMSVAIGDIVIIDTGTLEPGTLTRYEVLSIIQSDYTTPTVLAQYMVNNDNASPDPDLSWALGAEGIITRPSDNYNLLPVISPNVQLTTDRLSFYILNYNLVSILDNLTGADGKSAYDVAVDQGYVGSESEWVNSLNGKSAYEIAYDLDPTIGTESEWITSLQGKSAYELAVDGGYTGTLEEWLQTLDTSKFIEDVATSDLHFRASGEWITAYGITMSEGTLIIDAGDLS